MNEELRSLTWKYFFQQKAKELIFYPLVILGFGFIFANLARFAESKQHFFGFEGELLCEKLSGWCWLGYGLMGFIISCMIFIILAGLISLIWIFIEWNWKGAEKRAKKELKKK